MDRGTDLNTATLKIFHHHLYELAKGLRPLAMMTLSREEGRIIEMQLTSSGTPHHVQQVCRAKVNVIFGRPAAVATVRTFLCHRLCDLTPEQDFMLGILLGYDREQQCLRYMTRSAEPAEPMVETEVATGMLH